MLADPHRARVGYRKIPAQDDGRRLEENAPAVGQPRDAQAISESRDRSAQFMQAVAYAAMGGMSPAQFEAIAREHSQGCVTKYLQGRGRLRGEIMRCYAKNVTAWVSRMY